MTKAAELQLRAADLPEPLAAEVLDFLEFLAARKPKQPGHRQDVVTRLRGALKGTLSTSAAFAASKTSEKTLER